MNNTEDHDLLIKLITRFDSFEKMNDRMWESLNDKLSRFLVEIGTKADKQEVVHLQVKINEVAERIEKIEDGLNTAKTKKETIINLGQIGLKTYVFITGLVLFVIAILQALKN